MKTSHSRWSFLLVLFVLAACTQQPQQQPAAAPDTRAQDEAAIRSASQQWAAAAQAKDAEKFVSFYADEATLLLEDSPDFQGKSAIREAVGGMMQDPNFALTFETTHVEVARSGDFAYERSTYSLTTTDPKTKKPVTEKGSGLVVWQKQADGQWKALVDVPVSDPAS